MRSIVQSAGLVLMLSTVALATGAARAQVMVAVSEAQIATVVAACDGAGCDTAVSALISSLRAANPAAPVSAVAAAIAAEIAAGYNAGAIPPAIAINALSVAAARSGSASVIAAIRTAIASISDGAPIGMEAVALSGSPN